MVAEVSSMNSPRFVSVTDTEKSLLSDTLNQGIKPTDTGCNYLSKLVINLKNAGWIKLQRIQNLFESGKWVNNHTVMRKLEKNCTELSAFLKSNSPNKLNDISKFTSNIIDMRGVCVLLKNKTQQTKRLAKIEKCIRTITNEIANQWVNAYEKKTIRELNQALHELTNLARDKYNLADSLPEGQKAILNQLLLKDVSKMSTLRVINYFESLLDLIERGLVQAKHATWQQHEDDEVELVIDAASKNDLFSAYNKVISLHYDLYEIWYG